MLLSEDQQPVRIYSFWEPFVLSILGGVLAVSLAFLFAGAGHGTYLPAKLLFPYTMVSTGAFESIVPLFAIIGLFQFPFYGLILGLAAKKGKLAYAANLLAIVHVFFTVLSLAFSGEGFSP